MSWGPIHPRELWAYRALLYALIQREITIRYQRLGRGVIKAIVRCLLLTIVFSIVFGQLLKVDVGGVPYPIFALCGIAAWQFITSAMNGSGNPVVSGQRFGARTYFPRILLPIATSMAATLELAGVLLLLAATMAVWGVPVGPAAWTVPIWIVAAFLTGLGVASWLSALSVVSPATRDSVSFLSLVWLFATPVVYPSTVVPEAWQSWYALNPLAGVVDGLRWALFGTAMSQPRLPAVVSLLMACVLAATGVLFFRRTEWVFADWFEIRTQRKTLL